uniref:Uncharacterized protein n=1 Tax=Arundo donax TaxID=35708 RepID=A0A0A9GV12_ARUDO
MQLVSKPEQFDVMVCIHSYHVNAILFLT